MGSTFNEIVALGKKFFKDVKVFNCLLYTSPSPRDSIQTGELCKEAMIFSKEVVSEKGFFISKIFMGGTFNEIVALGKKIFKEVKVFKPKSSRKDSKESFIICKNLR